MDLSIMNSLLAGHVWNVFCFRSWNLIFIKTGLCRHWFHYTITKWCTNTMVIFTAHVNFGINLGTKYLRQGQLVHELDICLLSGIKYYRLRHDQHLLCCLYSKYYVMTVWIWAGNDINFAIAVGLIRQHIDGLVQDVFQCVSNGVSPVLH